MNIPSEIQESKHWLRMIAAALPKVIEQSGTFWKEAQELTLIFQKIVTTLNKGKL